MRVEFTSEHLEEACRVTRTSIEAAREIPALAIALNLTAEAIARRQLAPKPRRTARVIDFKKIHAGDID